MALKDETWFQLKKKRIKAIKELAKRFDGDETKAENEYRKQLAAEARETAARMRIFVENCGAAPVHYEEPEEDEPCEAEKLVGKKAFQNWLREINKNRR